MDETARAQVVYPETNRLPLPDSDYQGPVYRYVVEGLRWWFRDRPDVYVTGDLFLLCRGG